MVLNVDQNVLKPRHQCLPMDSLLLMVIYSPIESGDDIMVLKREDGTQKE